jgi:hypothetical protein
MSKALVGKTVTAIYLSSDKEKIKFEVGGEEPIVAFTVADCCSITWIEAVEIPALGLPAKVIEMQDLDLSLLAEDDHPEYDYLQFYGVKLVTDRGELVIDYRNSSNGYYGGNLVWPGGATSRYETPSNDSTWNKVA